MRGNAVAGCRGRPLPQIDRCAAQRLGSIGERAGGRVVRFDLAQHPRRPRRRQQADHVAEQRRREAQREVEPVVAQIEAEPAGRDAQRKRPRGADEPFDVDPPVAAPAHRGPGREIRHERRLVRVHGTTFALRAPVQFAPWGGPAALMDHLRAARSGAIRALGRPGGAHGSRAPKGTACRHGRCGPA